MKRSVMALLFLLAACPADDPSSIAPETPLAEMSAAELRGLCDEEVARHHDDLAQAAQALDCVVAALTNLDPSTCQPDALEQCLASLPATSDEQVSCFISDDRIAELQRCEEASAQEFRDCLVEQITINSRLAEATCEDVAQIVIDFDRACAPAQERCPAIRFDFLLSE